MARMAAAAPGRFPEAQLALRRTGLPGFLEVAGASRIAQALQIARWQQHENVLSLKNEDLWQSPIDEINKIVNWLGLNVENTAEIWESARSKPSLTDAKNFPHIRWCEQTENIFRDLGGPEANNFLGYKR